METENEERPGGRAVQASAVDETTKFILKSLGLGEAQGVPLVEMLQRIEQIAPTVATMAVDATIARHLQEESKRDSAEDFSFSRLLSGAQLAEARTKMIETLTREFIEKALLAVELSRISESARPQ